MAERKNLFHRKLFWATLFGAALTFFIFFQPGSVLLPVRAVLLTVLWPFQKVVAPVAFEVRNLGGFLGSISDLKERNENLEKERRALLAENARLTLQVKESEEIRRSFDLLPRDRFDLSATRIIGRDTENVSGLVEIDQGSADGIETGMPVIVEAGVLVGRVDEVLSHSSKVMILNHPNSVVNGVTTATAARGVVRGEHGLGVIYGMVQQNASLKDGDTVVTSGLGGRTPEGLLIGTLSEVKLAPDQLFQQATILPPVSYADLRFLFVIKGTR
ncbi:MAG: rod shape-determining protein MreC [Candidatus Moraniibacteriota bacterium]